MFWNCNGCTFNTRMVCKQWSRDWLIDNLKKSSPCNWWLVYKLCISYAKPICKNVKMVIFRKPFNRVTLWPLETKVTLKHFDTMGVWGGATTHFHCICFCYNMLNSKHRKVKLIFLEYLSFFFTARKRIC